MIVYFFDLKFSNERQFNALKRRFYYNLNRLKGKPDFRTKSVLVFDNSAEELLDTFFKKYATESKVYKVKCRHIEQVC
ncbi:hypothetical protein COT30_03755 [Candidatus Micrarchaeota archaeon CG08_land_8_20_14_0_20_49_17]|nr:MAG: hypothetical protein AUJ13_05290 [Candidatus Micrarchaeota archaeon CG1_02_49_24]PIU09572.1 MAG: hypothetical protein COT30_03755 [Candidatus Micrarchaeota archaeon CG08_land_8_20_14_0_20_49_17]PIU81416.1 MAG: hypothetical protein COS70_04190 [Candidatus Micrarchaeota archaeon CG06_land_8_20_14_3_00_50_6]PIZ92191.1 MAG: hypothetical protein COX84_07265 [Candidatus Micrarchaeota archaeon CG_4_10_14_0_2_um_filter_49_7]